MVRKWMTLINYSISVVIAGLLLSSLIFFLMKESSFSLNNAATAIPSLPKNYFSRTEDEYKAITAPALSLKFSPLSARLPDLRRQLTFFGKNGRPDAQEEKLSFFFSFTGNKTATRVFPEEKTYILYDKTSQPNQYIFSKNNQPTTLSLLVKQEENQAIVNLEMTGDNDLILKEPKEHAEFTLPEKEFARFSSLATWELGKWRVDGTLLARQKSRWYGVDKFIERHGGDEYKDKKGKQRIDFGEGEELYSVYMTLLDCLMWKDNKWVLVDACEKSLDYTLLCIKKIDDKVMNLELWGVEGRGKIILNLVKVNEPIPFQNIEKSFKFIGARTRSQFIFEINKERFVLSPSDWLLFHDSKWKKLVTPKEIDDYVDRKITGPLFVFDRIDRIEEEQIVVGTLFNGSRTEIIPVEFPLQKSHIKNDSNKLKLNKSIKKEKKTTVSPIIKEINRSSISPTYQQKVITDLEKDEVEDDDDDDDENNP